MLSPIPLLSLVRLRVVAARTEDDKVVDGQRRDGYGQCTVRSGHRDEQIDELMRVVRVGAAVTLSFLGLVVPQTAVSATGQHSCVNLIDACMGEKNSTSPAHHYGTSGNKSILAGYTYSDGTDMDDRVSSVGCEPS